LKFRLKQCRTYITFGVEAIRRQHPALKPPGGLIAHLR